MAWSRAVLTLAICTSLGLSGCLWFDPIDVTVPEPNISFSCDDEPRMVHEETGLTLIPAPLDAVEVLRASGTARFSLDANHTQVTWVLGEFGVGGTPNIAYEARIWLDGPDGRVWNEEVSGLADGYKAGSESFTVPAGSYELGWDILGAGTQYRLLVEEGDCIPIKIFP